MKKLELKEAKNFVSAVLIVGVKQQDAVDVDGVTLQSCSINYVPARGEKFTTSNVGSDASTYGTNLANVLMSTKKELNEILPLVGKVCLVSGTVGYYADKKSEVYKPVLKIQNCLEYTEAMKSAVPKAKDSTFLASFADEKTALTVLKPKAERVAPKADAPVKTIFETLGKTESEWLALDVEVRTEIAGKHIADNNIKGIGAKTILDASKA